MAQKVIRKAEVTDNPNAVMQRAHVNKTGVLLANSAYTELKNEFRSRGYNNVPIATEVVNGKELYKVSEWRKDGVPVTIRVEYRVPLYTNSNGVLRKGKRVNIISA